MTFALLLILALVVIVHEEIRITDALARVVEAQSKVQATEQSLVDAKREYATELQLRRYNLDWFISHDFKDMEVKVGVLEKTTRSK